jgi:aminoglycoside phosphotransferase (APT) family kinase protein
MSDEMADRLLCVLRTRTETPTLKYADNPTRLTGGFWAELVAFELREPPAGWEGPLVARVMPEPSLARKETVVQTAVALAGVPTPRVRGGGGPDAGLGRAFIVMDHAAGVPLLEGLDSAAGLLGAPRRLWRMPDLLADAMAKLHNVDPDPVREQLANVEDVARTVPEMLDHIEAWTTVTERADLVSATRWLIEHPVAAGADVICHGDLHPFNMLIDDNGRVTVLDWSAAVLAPPALDVAFTSLMLSNPPLAAPGSVRPLLRGAGHGLARRFRSCYRVHSGRSIDRATLDWFQAVVCLRALAEASSWVHDGIVESRAGHPWLLSGDRFAAHLRAVTGVPVRAL